MNKNILSLVSNGTIAILVLALLGFGIFVGKNIYDNQNDVFKHEKILKIKRVAIADATPENKRNDQASIIRLDDGRLLVAYGHFGGGSMDHDTSSIYFKTSEDDGDTWSHKKELISNLNLGTHLPSLYKKENGNVLVVFFVRESNDSYTSTIRQMEFSPDLTSIIKENRILVPGSYSPTGSDRLFYDEVNNRLLMPYPEKLKGPGWSMGTLYQTKILVSDDFGDTWQDSGIIVNGFKDDRGFGGAVEAGIYKNKDRLTVFSRNITGRVGACDIVWNGKGYTKDNEYRMKLKAKNTQSSIKYVELLRGWVATHSRLVDTDTPGTYNRYQLDVSFSSNGVDWNKIFTVDDVEQVGGSTVNNVNIYIEDDQVFITYSFNDESADNEHNNTSSLKLLKLPLTVF
ncbi:glycoside hydrolase [Arenibacter sp. F26102]|uniref:sialidase family protein n=1 Tax=Arenibacter sp. F26102 TaxID=2926416 RepID=UPI001FF3D97F|nr:sialidase family protein [Arenibacter sp. F26102]MCK0147281.1 glycoside hydrolase [Arenibacter sp. F26102]